MGARIYFLHILFISFGKNSNPAIEKSQKNMGFFSLRHFQGFLFPLPECGGRTRPLRVSWPFLLGGGSGSVEAWGGRGDGWHRGAPNSFTTPALSPVDVLLLAVSTVTVLTVPPCAVVCVCVFSLTVNKGCDCAAGSCSSLSWERAGVRGKGGLTPWEHLSNALGRRSLF